MDMRQQQQYMPERNPQHGMSLDERFALMEEKINKIYRFTEGIKRFFMILTGAFVMLIVVIIALR